MERELCDVLGIGATERAGYCGRGTKFQVVERPVLQQHVSGTFPRYSQGSRMLRRYQVWLEGLAYLHGKEQSWDSAGVQDLVRKLEAPVQ
eukprot:4866030-Pyramimonas_sp.AAC.1